VSPTNSEALVSPEWLAAHLEDPEVRVIDIAGLGQDEMEAYRTATSRRRCWKWKDMLWDRARARFPGSGRIRARLGAAA